MQNIHTLLKNQVLLPVLAVVCVGVIVLTHLFGSMVTMVVIGLLLLLTLCYVSYRFPRYNITILLIPSFFMPFIIKAMHLYGIPISNSIEASCLLILFILVLNKKISGLKTVPGIAIMIWIGYQFFELANPFTSSRVASVIALRSWVPMTCAFFIMYSSVESKRDVNVFIVGWFILALLAGGYGLYQELVGLPGYDLRWATSDEKLYNLLFTWGRLRKFSFFFSPTDFGIIMAFSGVAALIVAFFMRDTKIRIFAAIVCIVCLWAMLYTGTRTAMVLLCAGFAIYAAITLHRRVLIALGCFVLVIIGLIIRPTSSRTIFVMMTAFYASEDPSMNVRVRNQQTIRSYIQSHPIGFGLGSTGYLGMKYSPHTFVGAFPPDSEFVKMAIETGWVGLFMWCTILAVIFGYGINIYFKIRDPDWKVIMVMLLVVFFMTIVSQYPQELFRSQVLSILFASLIGMMAKIGTKMNKKTLYEQDQ